MQSFAIIHPPYKYKTPPNPKTHPEIHPISPSKTENRGTNIQNCVIFRRFCLFGGWAFFLHVGFGGRFGAYLGVYFWVRRGLYSVWGRYGRKAMSSPLSSSSRSGSSSKSLWQEEGVPALLPLLRGAHKGTDLR